MRDRYASPTTNRAQGGTHLRASLAVTALAACLFVAACGGNNNGSVTPAPTPSSSPAPSPTPTPAPSPTPAPAPTNTDLVSLVADQAFVTTTVGLDTFRAQDGLRIDAQRAPATSDSLSYISASRAYAFLLRGSFYAQDAVVTFTPDQKVTERSTSSVTLYRHRSGAGMSPDAYELEVFNPGSANDRLQLRYATFGSFRFIRSTIFGDSQTDWRPLAFGLPLASGAAPVSGAIAYNGLVSGRGVSGVVSIYPKQSVYDISGSAQLTVDYATHEIAGVLTLTATDGANGGTVYELGRFALRGALSADASRWSATLSDGVASGFIAGPHAEEAAGAFSLTLPDPVTPSLTLTIVGSFASKQ
ncbi:hypothetical protein ACMGDM_02580 [Sphingomonas sp. DT-51]|uniref:hypothetical protein n=1 Tax=Sphingomonas sp. DT-51 TaxID=3396165 RepID=UPI003F1C6374